MMLQFFSTIAQYRNWNTKSCENLLDERSSYGFSFFVANWECFDPLCEWINACQDPYKADVGSAVWSCQINGEPFERRAGNNCL